MFPIRMRGLFFVVLFGLFAIAHSQFNFGNIFRGGRNNRGRNNGGRQNGGGGGGGCRNSGPNHSFQGRNYILSWQNGKLN